MIELEKVFADNRFDIHCEYCSQRITHEMFHVSAFLYGAFFLQGKTEKFYSTNMTGGYLGGQCPSCLKTLIFYGTIEAVYEAKQNLLFNVIFGGAPNSPILKYHNFTGNLDCGSYGLPVDYNRTHIGPAIGEAVNTQEKMDFDFDVDQTTKSDSFSFADKYVSYFDGTPIVGVYSFEFFTEEEIKKAIEIENEHNYRIFPRYIYSQSLNEVLAIFCLKYQLVHEEFQKGLDNLHTEKHQISEEELDDIEFINESARVTHESFENAKFNLSKAQEFQLQADFLKILFQSTVGWQVESNTFDLSQILLVKDPFKGKNLSGSSTICFDDLPFDQSKFDRNKAIKTIQENHSKRVVRDFIENQHGNFIKDYIRCYLTPNYSFARLWELKEKYLKGLYDQILETKLKRPSQKHKAAARRVAKKLWEKDPDITIEEMLNRNEVHDMFERQSYHEGTLRKWLKDLCPNRRPGRRPKKAQKK